VQSPTTTTRRLATVGLLTPSFEGNSFQQQRKFAHTRLKTPGYLTVETQSRLGLTQYQAVTDEQTEKQTKLS